jgi:hypothetical protein
MFKLDVPYNLLILLSDAAMTGEIPKRKEKGKVFGVIQKKG